jgi:hypothetical protein
MLREQNTATLSNDKPDSPKDRNMKTLPIQSWIEIGLIFAVFVAFSSQPTPDVNEAHYLAKAKHFWNPDWCAGDIFLESSNAHWLFYVTFGWLTKFFSLSTVAWIGRGLTWGLLAFGWQRICQRLNFLPGTAVVAAMLFLLLNMNFHLAGEWVVGGFEAKGIAYGFVLLAISDVIVGRWKFGWLWLGVAGAFHVLVGGWAFLAMMFSYLLNRAASVNTSEHREVEDPAETPGSDWFRREPQPPRDNELAFASQLPFWLLGIGLLAVGAVPPLLANHGMALEDIASADQIYVKQRIAHHLNFADFAVRNTARFALMATGWLLLFQLCLQHRGERNQRRILFHFGVGSLIISLVGLCLSGWMEVQSNAAPDGSPVAILTGAIPAAGLLKFYWFRLADFAIPATLALQIAWGFGKSFGPGNTRFRKINTSLLILLIVVATSLMVADRYRDPRPIGDRRGLPTYPGEPLRTLQTFENWIRVNDWICEHTPPDAQFITPYEQQTFKWYSARAEVVNWKDVPQDASALLVWNRRVDELLWPQKRFDSGMLIYSDAQLRAIGARYDADYLLMPQWQVDLATERTGLQQVYPENSDARSTYVIFSLE